MLAVWLLHNLTSGRWGLVIRRLLEAATRVLPLMAVLFVPLAFGLPQIYELGAARRRPTTPNLQFKIATFLYPSFFLIRTAIYFVIWLGIAWLLNYWSAVQDKANDRQRRGALLTFKAAPPWCCTAWR